MANVFISHSDPAPAEALERAIRDSFPGQVDVFNSSHAASGLSAGQSIDYAIRDVIRDSSVVVWLSTPLSVRRSFWMAWELGVASALNKLVLSARCQGVRPDQLPLLQSGRNTPDLGEESGFVRLITDIKSAVNQSDDQIARVTQSLFKDSQKNVFWGKEDNTAIEIRIVGKRILIENNTDYALLPIRWVLSGLSELESSKQLPIGDKEIVAKERRIARLIGGSSISIGNSVHIEWQVQDEGRFYADIEIKG
jgi:hypothetical protein